MYRSTGKRVIDFALALVGLVVLSPVMAALAAIIKIEDRGPALFRQPRVGQHGREFTFLKFRSMPVDTPHVESAQADTLRITRVGRVIRRTSLDELPQLVNVVVGDMSLVGPRPPLASQEELIDLRKENGSLDLRPGLTGLAQINGYDGMSNIEKARWDGRYARTLSFLGDAKILFRTIGYLATPPPSY